MYSKSMYYEARDKIIHSKILGAEVQNIHLIELEANTFHPKLLFFMPENESL